MKAAGPAVALLAAGAAVQIGPAGSWLPSLRRRLAPGLEGPMAAGTIAVTFDDGPHPEGTPAVLDALDRLGWTAIFFLIGEQARRYPDVVRETVRRGHGIAVHGDRHDYLIARTPAAVGADLDRAFDGIAALAGDAPTWWRPPYGVLSGPALLAARRLRLHPVLWSAWGRDWRSLATPESVVADLCRGRLNGGTILLHDSDVMSAPGSWHTTVAALPLLAEQVAVAGLRVQALPE